jgi:hypothetical protein
LEERIHQQHAPRPLQHRLHQQSRQVHLLAAAAAAAAAACGRFMLVDFTFNILSVDVKQL